MHMRKHFLSAYERDYKTRRRSVTPALTPREEAMDGTVMKEILRHCNDNSDRPVYNWIGDKCEVERSVTYREFSERTQEIAEGLLLSLQIRRGERVILCYPPGLDFILSLIACLRAGFTAGEHTPPIHRNATHSFMSCTPTGNHCREFSLYFSRHLAYV